MKDSSVPMFCYQVWYDVVKGALLARVSESCMNKSYSSSHGSNMPQFKINYNKVSGFLINWRLGGLLLNYDVNSVNC